MNEGSARPATAEGKLLATGEGGPADLVLEGGGVKGIGLAGAVLALDEAGYEFRRVAGTSAGAIAGAIIAALVVAKQPIGELRRHLASIDYGRFEAKSRIRAALGPAGDAANLLLHMGLYDGDYLHEWLGGVLAEIGPTHFGDLRLHDGGADANWSEDQSYSLVVHTADITRAKLVRLPWDYREYGRTPDSERIVDAVRASMSIPFFFEPVRFNAPATSVAGVDYAGGRVTWVDGGLLDNFPVDVFDRSDGAPSRWPTIGVKLSAREVTVPAGHDPDDVAGEAVSCLHTLLANADRVYIEPAKAARTIFVDTAGLRATDFHLTPEQQQTLFANGQIAAATWITASKDRALATRSPH